MKVKLAFQIKRECFSFCPKYCIGYTYTESECAGCSIVAKSLQTIVCQAPLSLEFFR